MVVFGLWFYLSSAAVLIGAEVNAELLEAAYEKLPVKEVPKRASEHPMCDICDTNERSLASRRDSAKSRKPARRFGKRQLVSWRFHLFHLAVPGCREHRTDEAAS
jgi:hypothetical protein